MMKNQRGFTLVEMLIVMLIISVLLVLVVPNIASQSEGVSSKGCKAFESMLISQVQAYKMNKGVYPATTKVLLDEDYITSETCSEGHTFTIDVNGKVTHESNGQ